MNGNPLQDLRLLTQGFTDLSDAQWESFAKICKIRKLKKGDFFIKQEDPCGRVGFVSEGLLRTFYSDQNGKESTRSFGGKGKFVGPLTSLILKIPSLASTQAIEDSVMYEFSYKALTDLYKSDIKWESLGRQISEKISVERELREYELLTLTAGERLLKLEIEAPDWFSKVTKSLIASYLGISPISLSRLYRERYKI